MSASNHNYVCFECQTAVRYPKRAESAPKCMNCGSECYCLGYKVAIPKREDVKLWQAIKAESLRRDQEFIDASRIKKVRRQHFLEQEIQRLRDKPNNPNRNRDIDSYSRELNRLIEIQQIPAQ